MMEMEAVLKRKIDEVLDMYKVLGQEKKQKKDNTDNNNEPPLPSSSQQQHRIVINVSTTRRSRSGRRQWLDALHSGGTNSGLLNT